MHSYPGEHSLTDMTRPQDSCVNTSTLAAESGRPQEN